MVNLESIEGQFMMAYSNCIDNNDEGRINELINKFEEMYYYKSEHEIASPYCSLKVYQRDFDERIVRYLEESEDAIELDFVSMEKDQMFSPEKSLEDGSITNFENHFLTSKYFNVDLKRANSKMHKSITHSIRRRSELLSDLFSTYMSTNQFRNYDKLEQELNLQDLPKLNIKQRYYLFEKLSSLSNINKANILQKDKNKLLALIMGISHDNAKHLMNKSKKASQEEQEIIDEFLTKIGLE